MCGAYGFLVKDAREVYNRFDIQNTLLDFKPRWNIRPGQMNPVVTSHSPNIIQRMFWGLIPHFATDKNYKYKTIFLNGVRYRVNITRQDRELHIRFSADGRNARLSKRTTTALPIDSSGTISKLLLSGPDEIQRHLLRELTAFDIIIRATYSWTMGKIAAAVCEAKTRFERNLLSLLRQHLHAANKDRLKNDLWLCLVTDDHVVYVIDDDEYRLMIERVGQTTFFTSEGLAQLVAYLINCHVPYNLSFSKRALEVGNRYDFQVDTSAYRRTLTGLQVAQEATYRERMSLQPSCGISAVRCWPCTHPAWQVSMS